LAIGLPALPPNVQGRVKLRLVRGGDADREWSAGAVRALNLGDPILGQERLEHFEEHFSRGNPGVIYNLGLLMINTGRPVPAQFHAVRLISLGLGDLGRELYTRAGHAREWRRSREDVQADVVRVRDWDLAGHHGLVTLSATRRFVVGLDGCHWETYSEVIQVLRRAAARKMRRILFPFEEGVGFFLHSEIRIHRQDGKIVTLPMDRFSIGSAEDDNPFIPVARRKAGQWLLPDLEVGDAVELNYSLLNRDKGDATHPGLFLMSSFALGVAPILEGRVEIYNPYGLELEYARRNGAAKPEYSVDRVTGFPRYSFVAHRLEPRFNTGLPFENNQLNPLVACSIKGGGWKDLAARLLGPHLAAMENHQGPPEPLLEVIEGPGTPEEALARAFYWVRDRIKYGSVESTNRMVSSELRAAHLVAAGMGDCKDKSFLLALVCRHLKLEYEFMFVSTDNGLIVEELPADQFNHIIIRAKLPDRWVYLDAAADQGTFGNIPFTLQGLQGLDSAGGGELVTIPEDTADRNRILISEEIEDFRDGWMLTEIDMTLEGNLARYFDEVWKHHSLNAQGAGKAAESSLRLLFPDLVVEEFQRHGDTSASDRCRITCQGRRSRLVSLGPRRLAYFGWINPSLNLEWARRVDIQDRFLFPFCQKMEINVRITGRALAALKDHSRVKVYETTFGRVGDSLTRDHESLTLQRRISMSQRTVAGVALEKLPSFLTAFEDALDMVVAFDGPGAGSEPTGTGP